MACSTSTSTSCNTARCSPTCPCSHVCTHLHTYYKLHMYPVRTYSTYSCGCLGCAFFQSGAGMPLPHCSQSGLVPRLARLAGIVGAASAKKNETHSPSPKCCNTCSLFTRCGVSGPNTAAARPWARHFYPYISRQPHGLISGSLVYLPRPTTFISLYLPRAHLSLRTSTWL